MVIFPIEDALTVGSYTIGLARQVHPGMTVKNAYDGQFYYAMTFDPLLISKKSVPYLDAPAYRYRRMFYPLLGFLLAFGKPELFPYSLFFVNVLAWVLLGAALFKIAGSLEIPKFWTVVGGMSVTGITFTTFRTLPETPALALALWGCYFWSARRYALSAVLLGLSGLTKEVSIIIPLTLVAWGLYSREFKWTQAVLFSLLSCVPPVAWTAFVNLRLPGLTELSLNRFDFPLRAIFRETDFSFRILTTAMEYVRSVSIVAMTLPLIFISFWYVWKAPTLWGILTFTQALLCATVWDDIWTFHAGSARVVACLTLFSIIWYFEISKLSGTKSMAAPILQNILSL